MNSMNVVAGILRNEDGRILLTERIGDSPFVGLWEFPGGKIRPGEESADALRRELAEELGIEASSFTHFMNVDHRYDDRHVALQFYVVGEWQGEPEGLDGQKLRWESPQQLAARELLPADEPVLHALQNGR